VENEVVEGDIEAVVIGRRISLSGELIMQAENEADRKLNVRSTMQRELIQQILRNAEEHLDADKIYEQARWRSPGISLSTVYRNLHLFKEMGLVEEHQFESRRYYEYTPKAKHHHLICLGCGRVFEFKCPSTEKIKSRISREEGFKVTGAEVRLSGYCPECQERMNVNTVQNGTISNQEEVR
jgi:Fur family ferric uptake transcriptional regulator